MKPSSGKERPVVFIVTILLLASVVESTLVTVNSRPFMCAAAAASAARNSPAIRIFPLFVIGGVVVPKLTVIVFCVASNLTVYAGLEVLAFT